MAQTEAVHDDGHPTITQEGDLPDAVWHVDRPIERMQTFPARHYADRCCAAYHAVDGFREEKTGECEVPPTIARGTIPGLLERKDLYLEEIDQAES
jgi:hypothetical protein